MSSFSGHSLQATSTQILCSSFQQSLGQKATNRRVIRRNFELQVCAQCESHSETSPRWKKKFGVTWGVSSELIRWVMWYVDMENYIVHNAKPRECYWVLRFMWVHLQKSCSILDSWWVILHVGYFRYFHHSSSRETLQDSKRQSIGIVARLPNVRRLNAEALKFHGLNTTSSYCRSFGQYCGGLLPTAASDSDENDMIYSGRRGDKYSISKQNRMSQAE
jgi:hypothetical protein